MHIQPGEKQVPILMYHSIARSSNARFKPFAVPPEMFVEQMAYLHEHQYTPITVTDLIHARANSSVRLPERSIVLTFDDGFADFYTTALPVLNQYNFAVTLFVATAFVEGTSRWMRYERETTCPMLTWKQLAEITANRVECGAHSHSHPPLDTLLVTAARDEIVRSKKCLEDRLGQEIFSFAYPFGYYTARVRDLVREAGYTSACAVKHTISSGSDNAFSLTRLMVKGGSRMEDFVALLTGRSPSTTSAIHKMYIRARTPAWQLARRCAAPAARYLSERRVVQC